MSRVQVSAAQQQTNEASQQRKRKARAPKARTPEPKEIITGAGQPLDLGLRRELEERLGHDFSRVRVHTDRDAALLTDLLGADAVTVGEDVFFAEGRFRPGTEDGRRLVAHELLHTVQAPHPLGALKAGRDLGAVSMPQDAVEQQAEGGARSELPRPEVTRNATPGWLRYARVSADRFRTELLDPATLVDRLTAGILRSLRGDPTDTTGRVRQQLTRFAPELKASVLERLALRLPSSDHERLLELVERSERGPAETDAGVIPGPVTEPTHEPAEEPEVPPKDPPKDPAGEKGEEEEREKEEEKEEEGKEGKQKDKQKDKGKDEKSEEEAKEEEPAKDKESKPQAGETDPAGEKRPQEAAVGAARALVGAEPPRAGAAAQAPGAPEQQRMAGPHRPAEGSRPKAVDRRQDQQPGPARPEQVDKLAGAKDSPLARHGLLDDEKGKAEDEPLGVEAEAEKDVETPKDEEPEAAKPAGPELRPEDFVPSTDLDVSSVPTADRLDVSAGGSAAQEAPSFPEPPSTKADEIQQDRENEAGEEAEEAPEPPAPQQAAADRPAPAPEADVSAQRETDRESESRTARDLQPDQPVEQEVGPDPEAGRPEAGRQGPEAEQEAAPESSYGDDPGRQDAEPAAAEATPTDGRGRAERARPGPGGPGPSDPAGASGAMAETEDPGPGLGAMGPAAEQAEAPGALGAPGAQAGPDASMEEGGGACAGAPQPTTEEAGGGEGGCGGGGGGAGGKEKEAEKPAPPDVSGQDPQSALATAGTLPPDQMEPTLDGVDGAVDRSVGEQHAALEADAPTAQRPSGAPRTLSGTPEEAAPAQQVTEHVEREGAESGKEQKKAEGEKAGGPNPAADVPRPAVSDDPANQVSAQDVQNMQKAVGEVPVTDAALNRTVKAPKVQLSGESDPRRTDQQAENLKTSSAKILGVGREDAAKPMGEDQIYPDVPGETLRGDVPGGVGGTGSRRRAGAAAGAKPGVAVVAQQERGPQIQAAVGQGQGRMGQEQSQQKQAEAEERRESQEAQDQAVAENAEAQAGERGQAAEQVRAERTQWQTEQDEEIASADTDAVKEHGEKNKEIDTKRTDTDKDVGKRQDEDNKKIQDNRKEAEEKARKEKERKKEESSGAWGWVKSKVKAAFDALLNVITGIFDFFRKIVNGIIDKFREFANWAIEQARKFAVELIKKLADALIAIGDVLLAAFPGLREKFRNKIRQWRDQAIAKVNEWADKLKAAVNKLLDLLAAGLNKLLNLLEKGLKAAVNMVRDAVVAAIDFAQKAIAMLGQFAALVADIAPDPGGWLSKLGSAAKEGIQNHLWGAVKTAVKSWFNEKVESVLGLGKTIINVLVKGCVSMAQIGRMAWQALVQSLPAIIISIVVEKVVSMIVPAAGAIMTIIQGLMAAWGTISKIIAAFGKFFGFLKAVKGGVGAACLFAQAVAAGVVALFEFITNFLLSRLKLAAKGVGGRLKAMAQKIMKGLAKATKGPRKAAGAAVNRAKASLKRAGQALKGPRRTGSRPSPKKRPTRRERTPSGKATPAKAPARAGRPSLAGRALNGAKAAVKGALKKVGNAARALGRRLKNSKLGKSLTNSAKRIREAFKRQRDRLRERWNKRKQQRDERRKRENSPEAKEKRLARIVARIRPKIRKLFARGVPRPVLSAVLAGMRTWYRLSALAIRGAEKFGIQAVLNPEDLVLEGLKVTIPQREVLEFLHKLAIEIENNPVIVKAGEHVNISPKEPGVVPRHTVSKPVPPPAITRKTRGMDMIKQREQDALDFSDAGGEASLRRTQKGNKSAKKVVVGEGFKSAEQLSHIYLTKEVKGEKKVGIAEELTEKNQWNGFVKYADNFFRGKPQAKDIPRKERTDMLKAAWLLGGQEVERDPLAMVTNALTVQRLVKANEGGRGSGEMEKIFESLPAAFSGSESGGERLGEDLTGARPIEEEKASIRERRDRDLERLRQKAADPNAKPEDLAEERKKLDNKYARDMRPIRNAGTLADRHVNSVSAWIKDFGVEGKVEAMVRAMNIQSGQEYEAKVKELIFQEVRVAVIEMYTAAHRK
ncbi:eCIS core domain-containing protein [Streptomyces netropsis]|uniref:eCIS core domain-containing protein n=1 Tax=Streptomyces netropsis TaxID=55404 RepID=A0A7W7PES4_STRNE|nr:DUF4157 domain-containing protein [Streptomyces netropsis]MBB4888171.1 hypothetical protein [Streptomyces netropsis]GGR31529.1 hypothetical protein GCM10010219_40300 [Streptomyces netropsis]